MSEIKWIDSCRICKDEVCGIVDHLVKTKQTKSVRSAARMLSKQIDGEVSAGAIRELHRRAKMAQSVPPKKSINSRILNETCAISDLYKLIKSGKKFGTIYADPPWPYSNQATRSATDSHYDTMTLEDIANLPISELIKEKSHLHLWTTNAFIFECLKILEAWGFEYKSLFVWCKGTIQHGRLKPQMGIGNYWRLGTEFLITGVKGNLTFLDRNQINWIVARRTKHSSKPESIANIIEKVSPGPYLELFGRKTRERWTVWGNEIDRTLFNRQIFNE